MKKIICLLLCACLLSAFAGCKAKEPRDLSAERYQAMAEAALTLTETYNNVAQTAIDNGWEADFQTLKLMDQIADQAEEIIEAVNDPENVPDGRRVQLAELAQKLTTQLTEEVLPKVSEPFPEPEATEGQ